MQRMELAAGDRLLLGTAAGASNFTIAGASANSGSSDVHLGFAPRSPRLTIPLLPQPPSPAGRPRDIVR
jgi:hypothetical protein